MWSKAGRFVEGLHTICDILTKISVNCVINLHSALLFTCVFLWVTICVVISVFIFMGNCLYMLHVYVYY